MVPALHLNSMGSRLRQNLQVAEVFVLGTFAGHGCFCATEYLKEHLFENLMKHPKFITETKLAITLLVNDAAFLDSKRDTYRDDGNHLYVANIGDSRTVKSKAGKGIQY